MVYGILRMVNFAHGDVSMTGGYAACFSVPPTGPLALARDQEHVLTLFPRLKERMAQLAGTQSGGEQQMLAMDRALMSKPRVLLLDEPSMGLAPMLVDVIFETIPAINKLGVTVLLVEQNAFQALRLAHRGYVLVNGRITMAGPGAELLARPEIRAAYLEGAH